MTFSCRKSFKWETYLLMSSRCISSFTIVISHLGSNQYCALFKTTLRKPKSGDLLKTLPQSFLRKPKKCWKSIMVALSQQPLASGLCPPAPILRNATFQKTIIQKNVLFFLTLLATVELCSRVADQVHCETMVVAVNPMDTLPPASKAVSRLSASRYTYFRTWVRTQSGQGGENLWVGKGKLYV